MRKGIVGKVLTFVMVISLLGGVNTSRAEELNEDVINQEQQEIASVEDASKASSVPCVSYSGSNIEAQDYVTYGSPVYSYMTECSNGNYMLVERIKDTQKIYIQYFDKSYNLLSNRELTFDLPEFGGFYETDSNYYLLTGQENPNEDDSVEVFRITKYDKNWKRISSCGLFGANTYIPFDAGSARMTNVGDYLFVRTCHEMYKSTDGKHHQANVMIQIKMSTMEVTDYNTEVSNWAYGYVSHSFNQFICTEGNKLVAVDHGDAYPRCVALIKYPKDVTNGTFNVTWNERCACTSLIDIKGSLGDNYTGVSIGGFEISETAYIVAGNQDKEKEYPSYSGYYDKGRDVVVATMNKNTGDVSVNKITNYNEGVIASTPQLVKTGNNSFLLLWNVDELLYYVKLDGNGNIIGNICSIEGKLSDCKPIFSGNKVIWYTRNKSVINFYCINIGAMDAIKKEVNTGHEYQYSKEINNGKIVRTCIKCGDSGEYTVPTNFYCLWGTDGTSFSSIYDHCYSVGDFIYCYPEFYDSYDLDDMEVISSNEEVISITDSYWKIFELKAMKPGLCEITVRPKYNPGIGKKYRFFVGYSDGELNIENVECSPIPDQVYTGRQIEPKLELKYDGVVLNFGEDYSVSYDANTSVGQARITIWGEGVFSGRRDVYFNIICGEHIWNDGEIIKEATCVSEGIVRYTCLRCAETKDEVIEKLPPIVPKTAEVYIHEMSKDIIIAGLVLDVEDKSYLEFSWDASSDGGNTWETVSDWRTGHEWLDWTPDKFGDYVIVGKVRIKGEKEVVLKATANVSFHPHIKGKCQMPYSGEQGVGYLIGVESYDNPDQKYQYEMLILDCTLLAQGLPAWTYTTGQFKVPEGNAGWCIWTPQYGYYWTLFRVYDENGELIDEECFGFANIC